MATEAQIEAAADRIKQSISIAREDALWLARAALEAAEAAAWQPIETAPKDASELILRVPKHGWPTEYQIIGHWAEDLSGSEQPPFRGWFRDTGFGFAHIEPEPTHWRPVPTLCVKRSTDDASS